MGNIFNFRTDKCKAKGAALRIISSEWNRPINELNCYLHPLHNIASCVRSALKKCETEKGKVYGTDCIAANLIVAINKLRCKDGKGNPVGLLYFLNKASFHVGCCPAAGEITSM